MRFPLSQLGCCDCVHTSELTFKTQRNKWIAAHMCVEHHVLQRKRLHKEDCVKALELVAMAGALLFMSLSAVLCTADGS